MEGEEEEQLPCVGLGVNNNVGGGARLQGYYTDMGKQQAAQKQQQQADDAMRHQQLQQQLQQQLAALGGQQGANTGLMVPVASGVGGFQGFGSAQQLMDLVVGSVKKLNEVREPEKKKKKKVGVDDEDEEEILTPVVFDLAKISDDDGVDTICWEVRDKLRPYTGDLKEFWARQPRVVRPLREAIDADHLRLDGVNGTVTLRDHDRGAKRTIKQYAKANIQVARSKAYFTNVGHESHDVGLVKDYVECTGTYQIISALWQYAWNVWMIRRDDHSGFLMLAVLHHCKFFLPILVHKIKEEGGAGQEAGGGHQALR